VRLLLVTNMYPTMADPVFGVFVATQARALRSLGVKLTVVPNTVPATGAIANVSKYSRLYSATRAAAQKGEYDVVVGHFLYPTAWLARMAARRIGCPYAVVAHGTDVVSASGSGRLARLSREAAAEADLVVAVSEDLAARARRELAIPERVPVRAIHMGVDLAAFHPPEEDARPALGWGADERVALFVGNLTHAKGVDVLVEAFARAAGEGACDRLVLVGDGPERSAIASATERLGIAEHVDFAGVLPREDVAVRMGAADVLVLPSRREGLGLVVLESIACGTPAVASRVGGIPEVLPTPACGTLVEPDDPASLAAGMLEVLSEGKERYRDACVDEAARHGAPRMAEEFVGALRDVASGGRRSEGE
jgi:glycosyltransferase involved in cell wall biosynthesis